MDIDRIADYLGTFYRPEEHPALNAQIRLWEKNRPFAGAKLLDGTPVFRNTIVKYLALLAGGADLTVSVGRGIPHDPAILPQLTRFGLRIADDAARHETYDVVLDCAGVHADTPVRRGFVELTRSGMYRYRNAARPVFLADESRIKVIETGLGTGDGFRRGMAKFSFGDFHGRRIVLFGCGKVGRGIALHVLSGGAELTVVDRETVPVPAGSRLILLDDRAGVEAALDGAWCVVTATGIRHALAGKFDAAKLAASETILANMGVEDEFGPEIPEERVLNRKQPLNFVLEEPTLLKYIDPTMALDNFGALQLLTCDLPAGLNLPMPEQEEEILRTVREAGEITAELDGLEAMR